MGAAAFFGYLLLAGGPLSIVFLCIAQKSFLVLLLLGSAFYWLVTLFVISALFRGFAPLNPSIGPYVGLTLVAVLIQETAKYALWRFHKFSIRVLQFLAREQAHRGASLTVADHFSLSLTHGVAQSGVHALFFCVSWLPLAINDGTIYSNSCPHMSYFLVASLNALAFAGLLAGGTVVAFEAAERGDFKQAAVPSLAHLGAALLTLVNFANEGCLVSTPLLLIGGGAMAAKAGRVWWRRTGAALQTRESSRGLSPRDSSESPNGRAAE